MRSEIKTISRTVLLMLVAIISILAASAFTYAQGGMTTPFTGEWETVAGSNYHYTVRLTQTGNKVAGTYSPNHGKIFGGVVTGDKLTFKWTQDGGYEGTGEFTLEDDRKGFTGRSTAIKPVSQTNSWNTYKPPPPSSFAGTWETTSRIGVSMPLTIFQKGDKVTGIYPSHNIMLEGTVIGKVLRFKWESDAGSGSGQFSISTSGETFYGTFNKGDDPDIVISTWDGKRTSDGKDRR